MKFFSQKKKDDGFIIDAPKSEDIITPQSPKVAPAHKLTVDEVLGNKVPNAQRYDGKSALESLRQRMLQTAEPSAVTDTVPLKEPEDIKPTKKEAVPEEPKTAVTESKKTLLEKCKPFITDSEGNNASHNQAPLYKLQSVAEILENNRQKYIDRLAEQYDITVDDLGKSEPIAQPEPFVKEEPLPNADTEVIEINAFFENVQSSVPFNVTELQTEIEPTEQGNSLEEAGTITFTPISDEQTKKAKVMVTSNTQSIDLTGEIVPVENYENISSGETIELEKSEFEDFVPEEEIENESNIKKYIRKFSIAKRRGFLVTVFSFFITVILAFMKLPFMSGLVLGKTMPTMIVCTSLTFISILLNCDMFLSLKTVFSKKSVADVCPSIASLLVLAYAVMGILTGEIVLDTILLLSGILSLRALSKFRKESYMLSNLRQISKEGTKNAVRLIDDSTVTFAMSKNRIEGDALIAAAQQCNRVSDFIKYSTYGSFLNGKMPIITILSLIMAIVSAIAAANYYNGVVFGLYAAACILCFASLPSVFFINNFPLYAAAKKLNKKGSMIAGQTAAAHIEMANGLMLNSIDIFPKGTVTLHQMKVLSENNLDRTILRAASLTESLNSPLANIFKSITGDSNIDSLPDSDTIKYEERMGISGWVDDELLFIGNRTLMQAHGIDVPDIEVDRKILRSGYFPVYVASTDKVCALLVVQYNVDPDVAYELRKLSKAGVTMLVNNTDPNINEEMICDYLGLYSDSVMIMTNAGYHMYKNTAVKRDSFSAPAVFRFGNISIARIMNCASKIKRSNTILTVMYIISAVLGIMFFAYSSFAGSTTIVGGTTILLYSLICTAVSYIAYLFEKP
ncbi:MAG: cation-translocating P-type ATPase [Clostridia bacterium]|nr:cation-translocating P-type ATPase [Clostridia bacterium]